MGTGVQGRSGTREGGYRAGQRRVQGKAEAGTWQKRDGTGIGAGTGVRGGGYRGRGRGHKVPGEDGTEFRQQCYFLQNYF